MFFDEYINDNPDEIRVVFISTDSLQYIFSGML